MKPVRLAQYDEGHPNPTIAASMAQRWRAWSQLLARTAIDSPLKSRWKRYGFGLAVFLLSLSLRFALDPIMLDDDRGLVIFVPAVGLTALVAGLGPGAFVAMLTVIVGAYFFLPSASSFFLARGGMVGVATYMVVLGVELGLIYSVRSVIRQLQVERKNAEVLAAREKLLAGELQHRTQNLLSLVHGLAQHSFRGHDVKQARDTFLRRLTSLGRADERVMGVPAEGTTLGSLIQSELEAFGGRFKAAGPDIILNRENARNFSLLLHELATNAMKYGALSNTDGQVELNWSLSPKEQHMMRFCWRETGGPPVVAPRRKGFGTNLINGMFISPRLEYRPEGFWYESEVALRTLPAGIERYGRANSQ